LLRGECWTSPAGGSSSVEGERLKRIRDLLPGAARRAGMGEEAIDAGRVFRRWRTVVGPQIADHAEPTSLRNGVLRVRADSPAWATEIGYLGGDIRVRVNDAAGRPLVAEVRVWTGPASRRREPEEPTSGARVSASKEGSDGDPAEALERAHDAWRRNRSGASENHRKPW
jgi:hypothetical protein